MKSLALLLVVVPVAASAPVPKAPSNDATRVQGEWVWDAAVKPSDEEGGVLLERVAVKGDTLTLHCNKGGARYTCGCTFTLEGKARPKRIDFVPTDGDDGEKGRTYLGLYEVTKGKLRICYRPPPATRPKDFDDASDGGSATVYVSLTAARGP